MEEETEGNPSLSQPGVPCLALLIARLDGKSKHTFLGAALWAVLHKSSSNKGTVYRPLKNIWSLISLGNEAHINDLEKNSTGPQKSPQGENETQRAL